MLTALRIQNFAIIDELEVRFFPGFNALTGETGAGKSIIVDALHLILGGRASADVIRTGAEEASVEALFEGRGFGERLSELGIPIDLDSEGRGELLIRRVINRGGRGRAWVNGSIVTITLLEQVCRGLLDISGQHEHVSLLDSQLHLTLLDGYAGLQADLEAYKESYECFSSKLREKNRLATDDAERARRSDYLAFQLEELEEIAPKLNEDETLQVERKKLASAAKLKSAANSAERLLYSSESSAADLLASALSQLEDLAQVDHTLELAVGAIRSAKIEVDEAARSLASYSRNIVSDPAKLDEIEDRLEALKRLCRKHGGDLSAVLLRAKEMRAELDSIHRHSEILSQLEIECAKCGEEAFLKAKELSKKRHQAAGRFAKEVESELARLAMGSTVLEVAMTSGEAKGDGKDSNSASGQISASTLERSLSGSTYHCGVLLKQSGLDECELLISTNRGEEVKPLARIASGGELSRVMLAIKRVLAKTDPVFTYVFDEVDTGVGGAVAEVVGRLLRTVSENRQVLCITHLPQIAACADHHYTVEKIVREERTVSSIKLLTSEGRVEEIARMLAGVEVTRAALKNAEEMIESAKAGFSNSLIECPVVETTELTNGTENLKSSSRKPKRAVAKCEDSEPTVDLSAARPVHSRRSENLK